MDDGHGIRNEPPLVFLRDYWVVPTLPDYEEGGDTSVTDGCESHVEWLDLSRLEEEVVNKRSGGALYEACAALG